MGLPAQAYFPSNAMLNANFGTLHQTLGAGVDAEQGPVQFMSGDYSSIQETTQTVYLMTDFKVDDFFVPFAGNIGLRLIHANDTASGSLILPASYGTTLMPINYPSAPATALRRPRSIGRRLRMRPRAAATRRTCCRR